MTIIDKFQSGELPPVTILADDRQVAKIALYLVAVGAIIILAAKLVKRYL
jgi:hypothetical protein